MQFCCPHFTTHNHTLHSIYPCQSITPCTDSAQLRAPGRRQTPGGRSAGPGHAIHSDIINSNSQAA